MTVSLMTGSKCSSYITVCGLQEVGVDIENPFTASYHALPVSLQLHG